MPGPRDQVAGIRWGGVIKPRRFEMGVRLAERAERIQAEMSLGAAYIIPSSQTPFKKLISSCEDRF